eukprot:GHVU01140390.1.p1 GENE.GHVU01140390.1~~GHVU01140390.1.p1  ORF type:complete len:242 (+),score=43.44 GHVU01140390.1:711-1436(+)
MAGECGDTKVFALHARVFVAGTTYRLHLGTLEVGKEDAEALFKVICDLMNALDTHWISRWIAYTSDGATVVAGLGNGLAGRLYRLCATVSNKLAVFWCVAHRSQLGIKKSLVQCRVTPDGDVHCPVQASPAYAILGDSDDSVADHVSDLQLSADDAGDSVQEEDDDEAAWVIRAQLHGNARAESEAAGPAEEDTHLHMWGTVGDDDLDADDDYVDESDDDDDDDQGGRRGRQEQKVSIRAL